MVIGEVSVPSMDVNLPSIGGVSVPPLIDAKLPSLGRPPPPSKGSDAVKDNKGLSLTIG